MGAWREVLRRLLLLAGVGSAVAFALTPVPVVISVRLQDWPREFAELPGWRQQPGITLEAYVAGRVEGRVVNVGGPAWEVLFDAARRARGEPLWFRAGAEPVAGLVPQIGDHNPFVFATLARSGSQHLGVNWLRPMWARHQAPAAVLYPYRRTALMALALGLALYILIPWLGVSPESLHYSRVRGAILPDVVGLILFSMFFALPMFVIPANSPVPDLFAGDWAVLTLVGWGLSLFGILIFGVAAWYASFRVDATDDGFMITTLRGIDHLRWDEVVEVRRIRYQAPRWLLIAGAIGSFLSWRAAAPTLLMAGRNDPGLEIVARDGRRVRLWVNALEGGRKLLARLDALAGPS